MRTSSQASTALQTRPRHWAPRDRGRRTDLAVIAGGSLWCMGCAPAEEPSPQCDVNVSLIEHEGWTAMPIRDDPMTEFYDVGILGVCEPNSTLFESFGGEPSWSIDTKDCSWATVSQTAKIPVDAGEPLYVRVWHTEQSPSLATGVAHVNVGAQRMPMWDEEVPIPIEEGGLLSASFPAPESIPAGAELFWHVDNHGFNSWNLLEFSVVRSMDCPADDGPP